MKHIKRTYLIILAVFAVVLSACGGAPAAAPAEQAAIKVSASLIAYTGTVESIDGDQWVVNGETLTIDPAVIQDGPFQVGDTIKVEGDVSPDGSLTVTRIEMPSADDLAELPQIGDPPADGNTNDDNVNDANTNDDNANDANSNDDNANDDDGNSNDDDIDANSNDSYDDDSNSNDDDIDANSNDSYDDDSNSNDDNGDDDSNSNGNSNDDDGNDDDGNDDDHNSNGDDDSNSNDKVDDDDNSNGS